MAIFKQKRLHPSENFAGSHGNERDRSAERSAANESLVRL
jgi:hypothetical protein